MAALQATGILGGSFDPVHTGHIRIAEYCRRRLGLRQVRLIPVNQPAHREAPSAAAEHRLEMLRLAVADKPGLLADDIELRRGGPSYSVDTLKQIKQQRAAALCLIMGRDVFAALHTWRHWRRLFEYAHLVVLDRKARPGRPPGFRGGRFTRAWTANPPLHPAVAEQLKRRLSGDTRLARRQPAGKVFFLPLPPIAVSSTHTRRALQQGPAGRAAGHALPPAVLDYIRAHKLYT